MRLPVVVIAATVLGSTLLVRAQQSKEPAEPAYRVEFDIRDAGPADTQFGQHFSLLVYGSHKGILQTVRRVPEYAGATNYVDVGANIECSVRESDGKAALSAKIDMSDITGQVQLSAISLPIIGQRKAAFDTTVEWGKQTAVMAGKALALVEATVTRVN